MNDLRSRTESAEAERDHYRAAFERESDIRGRVERAYERATGHIWMNDEAPEGGMSGDEVARYRQALEKIAYGATFHNSRGRPLPSALCVEIAVRALQGTGVESAVQGARGKRSFSPGGQGAGFDGPGFACDVCDEGPHPLPPWKYHNRAWPENDESRP